MNINISTSHSCRMNELCGPLNVRVEIGGSGIRFVDVNDLCVVKIQN